ncbi:hypothetical protein T484DRAFT_1827432 [Baffinella frigidus]|nr:hypothetical protein T484DRAFT_1827432 [Cryptophyta sp. CCMP2293]
MKRAPLGTAVLTQDLWSLVGQSAVLTQDELEERRADVNTLAQKVEEAVGGVRAQKQRLDMLAVLAVGKRLDMLAVLAVGKEDPARALGPSSPGGAFAGNTGGNSNGGEAPSSPISSHIYDQPSRQT